MKTEFGPRKLMEKAIQVMRQSVPEPRADGKVDPKVGAGRATHYDVVCK